MEPQPVKTRSGLAYSVETPSGLRERPEVGTDVSPGAEMNSYSRYTLKNEKRKIKTFKSYTIYTINL